MPTPNRFAAAMLAGVTLLAAGCTTIEPPLQSDLQSSSAEIRDCAAWFTTLDDTVDGTDVGDAEAYRIPGFPYLRANRFLAAFHTQAQNDSAAFAAWEGHLRALDARARGYELQNLPPQFLPELGVASRSEAATRTERCAGVLASLDAASPSRKAALVERAQVPDDYADWKRALGLYPLTRIPFFQFAKDWESDAAGLFKQAAAGTAERHVIVRYQPPESAASAPAIAAMFANVKSDALGIPQFSDRDAEILFATYAPIYEVDTTGDFDRFGTLRWGNRTAPEVDVAHPTAFRRLAFTRYGARTLVQLVYLIWFPERPDDNWLDPLSGQLDGLIFRVTLDSSGRPLVYDSIHPCGCYHMFIPTALAKPIPPSDPRIEWAFVPRSLPPIEPPQRVLLRLTSRSHYLIDVRPDDGRPDDGRPNTGDGGVPYALADDGTLRTLATPEGTRSAFGPTGIVRGTERAERFVTWPLGLEEAGSMREWGRHATALIGRRHFDDADLIERRFEILPAADKSAGQHPSGG